MATSKGNKAATSTINKVDLHSNHSNYSSQQSVFRKWLQNRDNSIQPPKEQIPKSSSTCSRCVAHTTSCRPSSPSSTLFHHCTHNHQISNCSFTKQHHARPAISKQEITNEPKRNASAHCASHIVSTCSNQQHITTDESSAISAISSCSPTNTKQEGKGKSKIPVRISGNASSALKMTESTADNSSLLSTIDRWTTAGTKISRIPLRITTQDYTSPKQNEAFENSAEIPSDQEHHESFVSSVNHDDNQKLLLVSEHNDYETNCLICEEITATVTSQLDMTETRKKEKTNVDIDCVEAPQFDISLLNTQEHDSDQLKLKTIDINEYQENDTLALHENYFNNDALKALMQKQNELKAYYDSFPNIDNTIIETSPDIKKAKEYTDSILHNLPSGDVNDMNTVCHVLNKLLGNESQECLFYDSTRGINLHDASLNLADINSEDKPFVLKLESSYGLGNIKHIPTEQDDFELVQILTDIIDKNQSHPVIEDIITRLSKLHHVDKTFINIKSVYVGTFNIVYTVRDLARNIIKSLIKLAPRLKKQFKTFVSAKIHPLLFRPSFDIAYFDKRGNKTFPNESKTHQVGPPGREKLYTIPSGWTRYGLKVLSKYATDNWLDPFQDPGNWYRAFHGTGNAKSVDFGDKNQSSDDGFACVNALGSIFENGFRTARVDLYGPGVYCSPNPTFPENGYVHSVLLDTQQGKKSFKCMLQVAVNPDGVNIATDDIWVVPDPKNIRPYGIIIKEA